MLKRWEETGATDPASLTKMLRRKSLDTVLTILVQALLDAGQGMRHLHLIHPFLSATPMSELRCTVVRVRGVSAHCIHFGQLKVENNLRVLHESAGQDASPQGAIPYP